MTNLVRDEVFVNRKPVGRDDSCQHVAGFFRGAHADFFAAFNQHLVRKILIDGPARPEIVHDIEAQARSFDGGRGRGNPTRSSREELFSVGVGKSNGTYSGALELNEDRMVANDLQKGLIRKALFVRTNSGRSVNAGQDSRLSGRALWSSLDSQTRVGYCQHAVTGQIVRLSLK